MHAHKNKIDDVTKDSTKAQNSKCFVAQTVARIKKLSSHKKIVSTRPTKLDPMLICFDDFFSGKKLPHLGYTSYQDCAI